MLDLRTEEQLMVAAREGDEEAFRTLALRLRDVVSRFLRHLGCDETTVEDLVQETLLRLWSARSRYEQRAALRTYVLTIAKNLWLSHRRRDQTAREVAPADRGDEALDRLLLGHNHLPEPEAHLLRKYRLFRIRQAITALPERQRLVFVLAHIEDLRYAQIADMLGIAEGTVKSRMHRAIQNLRTTLEAEFPGFEEKEE